MRLRRLLSRRGRDGREMCDGGVDGVGNTYEKDVAVADVDLEGGFDRVLRAVRKE